MKKLLVSVILPVLVVAPITAGAQKQTLVDTRDLVPALLRRPTLGGRGGCHRPLWRAPEHLRGPR